MKISLFCQEKTSFFRKFTINFNVVKKKIDSCTRKIKFKDIYSISQIERKSNFFSWLSVYWFSAIGAFRYAPLSAIGKEIIVKRSLWFPDG